MSTPQHSPIPFLQLVANDLREQFGTDLSRVAVVFPGKRAGLFLNDFLTPPDGSPLWAPTYLSIDQLFNQISPLRPADPIETVCRLYKIYHKQLGSQSKSLDWFYGWGEQLLRDFDDIDCAMAPARQVFTNLYDIRKLEADAVSGVNAQQQLSVLRAALGLEPDATPPREGTLKHQFLEVWHQLYGIYRRLHLWLGLRGVATPGHLKRLAIEALHKGESTLPAQFSHYAFVGFGVLLPVEEQLFSFIHKEEKALFYWDYDNLLLSPQSPALGLAPAFRNNLTRFPNRISADQFNNLTRIPHIDFVAATSQSAQSRYIPAWLKQQLTPEERRTAIVLADEGMLQSAVQSIPAHSAGGPQEINITKGYPLTSTPAYAAMMRWLQSQENTGDTKAGSTANTADTLAALQHFLRTRALDGRRRYVPNSWQEQLFSESYFQCFTIAGRLHRLAEEGLLPAVQPATLSRLIHQVANSQGVAFHGEPATGLQLMGILETRCLDFTHLLVLAVEEGTLPRTRPEVSSFIPHDVRRAFGLALPEHHTAVFAYNFFRLLSRASHVTLVYNEATDGLRRGEMSRFMWQLLLIQTPSGSYLPIRRYTLRASGTEQNGTRRHTLLAASRAATSEPRRFSPSSLATYAACPLRFFFQHVAYLNEIEKDSDFLPPHVFGTIFHDAAHSAYAYLSKDTIIRADSLKNLADNTLKLDEWVRQAFTNASREAYIQRLMQDTSAWHDFCTQHLPDLTPEEQQALRSTNKLETLRALLIQKESSITPIFTPRRYALEFHVITDYLKRLLRYDAHFSNLHIMALETRHELEIGDMKISGILDRLDSISTSDGSTLLRVVDYKTGAWSPYKVSAGSMSELTTCQSHPKAYMLQTFLYCLACLRKLHSCGTDVPPVAPALYFLQRLAPNTDYQPYLTLENKTVTDFAEMAEDFRKELVTLATRIRTTDYTPTAESELCRTCPYTLLCHNAERA